MLYSNFVATLDGAVTLGSTPSAGSVISGRNAADRFLMALLRSFADAVLVGAGTLRATPGHHWTAEHVFPSLASEFAALRRNLGRAAEPRLVLITASGDIDTSHPAVADGATVVTNSEIGEALKLTLPESCDVIEVGKEGPIDLKAAVERLRERGYDAILTEGGPHVMGELIKRSLLDEIFLTMSPAIAGRDKESRLGMVAGVELMPQAGVWTRLLSARRHGDFLFLRYSVARTSGG